jgi:predicted amidophosphoribosyltransferase
MTSSGSLFRYAGIVKTLIHQAKIAGNPTALATILKLWREANISSKTFIAICPAPSSLYSRITGKIDIAAHLGHDLHQRFGTPMIMPPKEMFYRWRKQTASQRSSVLELARKPADSATILVVDDVITTGETIQRFDALFPERISYLTFASSGLTAKASLSKGFTTKGPKNSHNN